MHQPIRDNLEEFLTGPARELPNEFQEHLEACGDCADEVSLYRKHSHLLRSLHSDVEPSAGFYARVMDRIEQQGVNSIWSILLQPAFGRRLAVASAALVLLLGTYLVTTERSEPQYATAPEVMMTSAGPADLANYSQDTPQQQRERDAVLVNLAAFRQ
jgi:hypothetical protein